MLYKDISFSEKLNTCDSMTLIDGDITKGWIRDRVLLKLILSRKSSKQSNKAIDESKPKTLENRQAEKTVNKHKVRLPKVVYNYVSKIAKYISEETGEPYEVVFKRVLESEPTKKYIKKMTEYIEIEL